MNLSCLSCFAFLVLLPCLLFLFCWGFFVHWGVLFVGMDFVAFDFFQQIQFCECVNLSLNV